MEHVERGEVKTTMSATMIRPPADLEAAPLPVDSTDVKTLWQQVALALFIAVPFVP
jgi:hypothetical protein